MNVRKHLELNLRKKNMDNKTKIQNANSSTFEANPI